MHPWIPGSAVYIPTHQALVSPVPSSEMHLNMSIVFTCGILCVCLEILLYCDTVT